MWSVASAKSQLSEVLRLARAGTPQFIGTTDPCVLISAKLYRDKIEVDHDGAWLLEQTARLGLDLHLPPRVDRPVASFED